MSKIVYGKKYERYIRDMIMEKYKSCWLWEDIPPNILGERFYMNNKICNDIGCDIIGVNNDDSIDYIQCKNYSTTGKDNSINIYDLTGFYNFVAENNIVNAIVYYSGKLSRQVQNRTNNIKYINVPYLQDGQLPIYKHTNKKPTYLQNNNIPVNSAYKCVICVKYYKSYHSLWKHKKQFHKNTNVDANIQETNNLSEDVQTKNFYCKYCNNVYKHCQSKWNHEQKCSYKNIIDNSHHNIITQSDIKNNLNRTYNCKNCSKEYKHIQNRWRHERICNAINNSNKTDILIEQSNDLTREISELRGLIGQLRLSLSN